MQKQPIWNARNDPCVPLLHLLVLPFVIPLSRCCRLRLVRACLESTAFTDNIESFGGFDSDLANAGVHTAYAAVLEFRPASVAMIFHVSALLNIHSYLGSKLLPHLCLPPAPQHAR